MSSSSAIMSMKLQYSQGLLSSTVKIEEEDTVLTQKQQGTVTILASPSSLRRTLSADMSSKKWLPPQNIAEEKGENDAEVDDEAERERLEIWSSIQRNKKEEQEKAGSFDTWSSLISLKTKDESSKSLPATTPYIHPLVKTKSSLSDKSLEICTESLGSETGSDGLVSSYPPSETGDSEQEEEKQEEEEEEEEEEEKVIEEPELEPEEEEEEVIRYNYSTCAATKKSSSPPRSFPPPLPSLSSQTGPSLHMRPHRDNGRLVLQAVSLPSNNNFSVQRQDGRLVLTFANNNHQEDAADEKENDVVEELEEEFEAFEEDHNIDKDEKDEDEEDGDEDEDEDEDEYEYGDEDTESDIRDVTPVIEKAQVLSSGISSVKKLASCCKIDNNKAIGLVNRNPKWSEKFNEVVNFEDVDVVEATQMVQSLPPRPRVARLIPSPKGPSGAAAAATAAAAAGSFNLNAYEHYWRTKPTATDRTNPRAYYQENNDSALKMKNNSSKIIVSNEKKQLLVLRGKNGDYLVHNLKNCKDSRRSFLFWEPYCIATS